MTADRGTMDAWLSDDPITGNAASPDLLGRTSFASSVVEMLERVRTQSDSSVLALIGPWGSGKSSVLNMIKNDLTGTDGLRAEPNHWIVVDFNPWFYQDLASLQTGFFNDLRSSLPADSSWENVRKHLASFGRKIAPMGSLGAFIGLDASALITAGAEALESQASLAEIHADTDSALRKADRPVLMVLDDLDRLAPDELLLVFKLIRLTGRLFNMYYLVSYDEDTLLDALSRTGLVPDNDPRRALNYLDKIIQVRLDVPPLREQQASSWVDKAINDLAVRYKINLDDGNNFRFSRAYREHIRERLDTPRAIKRYFGQVDAFFGAVQHELDPVDFLLITWIRTAEPLVYKFLAKERNELLGLQGGGSLVELTKNDHQAAKEYWEKRLRNAKVSAPDIDGVAGIIGQLFPRFQAAWSGRDVNNETNPAMTRVAHPDYFDRYFSFGVPAEDISDALIQTAFQQIADNDPGPELAAVANEFHRKTSLIVNKLRRLVEPDASDGHRLILWLAERYHEVEDIFAFVTPRQQVLWFVEELAKHLSPSELTRTIEATVAVPEGLTFTAFWIHEATLQDHAHDNEAYGSALRKAARTRFVELIQNEFEKNRETNPLEIPASDWDLIWTWKQLDEDGLRQWLFEKTDSGGWPLIDLIARFAQTSAALGTKNPVFRLSRLDVETVDSLIGLDKVFKSLQGELDEVLDHLYRERTLEDTWENRRKFVLSTLKMVRDHSRSGSND